MNEDKKDYSVTLNLPKTDFPMRGNLPQNEPKILEEIINNKLYEKMLEKNKGNEPYVLHDGPPYANGEIHIGHALNKILKDTIVRYKNLKGYYTPFVPGYDTHGLPTEKKAIEKLGIKREETSITEFRNICRDFALSYVEKQTEGFKRLGCVAEWDNPYITLKPEFEAEQIKVFGEMFEKGYMYKGLKPVYWCTDCETALAEAEIEYADHKATSIYVKFEIKDSRNKFENIIPTYILIWTTTPWTLPGNTGITIGKDFEYSIIEANNERYILATELVKKVMELANINDYKEILKLKGEELEGITYKHPFLDRISPIVLGSDDTIAVELTTGTGAVHTAPGYGKEDYVCGLKNDLGLVVCVNGKGFQSEDAGPFAGLYYEKSNIEIIKWLAHNGYLLGKLNLIHQYPHCWRCKNPIVFRATNQWFASVKGFRDETLEQIKTVKWTPAWGEDRITNMVKDRSDWCISRQRTWGVPIPIFFCLECEKEYITKESIQKISEIFSKKGSNAWYEMNEKELMPDNAKCTCGCNEFKKETDIMDVWFDSGSSHRAVLKQRGLPDANMYLEGNDQYRGWFQSSLLTSVATTGKAPYKEVLTHGMVTDGQGRKMSKSLGNGINPKEVVDEYGADILRLWVLSSDFKSDVGISKDILKQTTEVYRKIRNTARFILGNISDFNPDTDSLKYDKLLEIDKFALLTLNELIEECTKSFEKYEYHTAINAINKFCVNDMSNFYLDIIKDRLYVSKKESFERKSAQSAMLEILNVLVRILAPILAFTAEEIWDCMPNKSSESIMLEKWPEVKTEYNNSAVKIKWDKIVNLKNKVTKELEIARTDKLIGQSLNAKITLYTNDFNFCKALKEELRTVFIVSDIEIIDSVEEKIEVTVAKGERCERCWMYSETVGMNPEDKYICKRCSDILYN